jgi:DNA-binding HxlR family transcriptional regulator
VEYSLTELGRSLIPILDSLIDWALEHYTAVAGNNPR